MSHAGVYLDEVGTIAKALPRADMEHLAHEISQLQVTGGRLFIAGLGGSAANASHAAADFRKLAGIEAVCLSDNAAELTARANDEGWDRIYADALRAHRAIHPDILLVLSVGGGTDTVSVPLVRAIDFSKEKGLRILGIVGRDGGYTKMHGDCVVIVPTVASARVTPHTEAFQAVILHYLVSHPAIQKGATKW